MRAKVRSAERKFQRDVGSAARKAGRQAEREFAAEQSKLERRLQAGRPRLQYTAVERSYLGDVRERLREDDHDRERDLFLCHAWADRQGPARELFDALREAGVDVWFSEEDVLLGMSLARQLDRGIRCSHVSVVLVTPAMLDALRRGGFADQELGALLGTGRVVPVLHGVHYEGLAGESPLLAARAGLSTAENSLADAAEKIAHGLFADN